MWQDHISYILFGLLSNNWYVVKHIPIIFKTKHDFFESWLDITIYIEKLKAWNAKIMEISLCLSKYYMIKIYGMWRFCSIGTRLSWVARCFMSVFPVALHRTFTLFIPCIMTKWKIYVTPTNALFNNLCILSYT